MAEQPNVYPARAGGNGEDEDYALENGLAVLGFSEFGSLEGLSDYEQVVSQIKHAAPGLKPRQVGNFAGQLWAFAIAMKEGDTV